MIILSLKNICNCFFMLLLIQDKYKMHNCIFNKYFFSLNYEWGKINCLTGILIIIYHFVQRKKHTQAAEEIL